MLWCTPSARLVAKCFCLGGKDDISAHFKGRNYGVGCPGGVEVVAHSLRDVLREQRGSDLALLKIDFKNAFNLVDRQAFMRLTCERFPALSAWTNWCYSSPSVLLYDHQYVIRSESGVQQGDPLGPLYFCFGLAPLVEEITALNPLYNKWYMDDGGIIAPVPVLLQVWEILKVKGPALGLHLNPSKCEWSWLSPGRCDAVPVPSVPLVPIDRVFMLGVPLGSDVFCSEFVNKELLSSLPKTLGLLSEFEDSQSAFFLLRVSYSVVRATHFMRTTPLGQWGDQAKEFDRQVRRTAETILGVPFTEEVYLQASLTPTLGGMGLRQAAVHAPAAYAASFRESQFTSGETWVAPLRSLCSR